MKNQVLLLLCLTSCLLQVNGQNTTDKQWLVLNEIGKMGVDQNALLQPNKYPPGNNIQAGFFVLENVDHPVRTPENPGAKNDLFVIYSDWNYLNTREKDNFPYTQNIDLFYPYAQTLQPPQQNMTDVIHNFSTPSPIKFMYLSNIYEDNDPPPDVKVQMGNNGTNSLKYTLTTTSTDSIMTASHDVIHNADITLIIKKQKVAPSDILYFNKVIDESGAEQTGNFFEPSNIFPSQGAFTCSNVSITDNLDGSITFNDNNSQSDYIFVNLRPTENLSDYYPNNTELNYAAVFKLKKGSTTKAILTENILMSHDPNFIQVISTCGNEKKGPYIYYHVEFFNEGNLAAGNLSIQLNLPDYLDVKCINVDSCMAGGEPAECTPSTNNGNNVVKFTFEEHAIVQAFNPDTMEKCTGYIEFCVKFKDNHTSDLTKSHKPLKSTVSFGPDSYLITDFRPIRNEEIPGPYVKFPNKRKGCSCKCSNPTKFVPN